MAEKQARKREGKGRRQREKVEDRGERSKTEGKSRGKRGKGVDIVEFDFFQVYFSDFVVKWPNEP